MDTRIPLRRDPLQDELARGQEVEEQARRGVPGAVASGPGGESDAPEMRDLMMSKGPVEVVACSPEC